MRPSVLQRLLLSALFALSLFGQGALFAQESKDPWGKTIKESCQIYETIYKQCESVKVPHDNHQCMYLLLADQRPTVNGDVSWYKERCAVKK